MKTKRLLLLLVLTLSSFFFFLGNVKADTYNYTFVNDPFQYLNTNDYNTYKQSVLDYRETKAEASSLHYILYWYQNRYRAYLLTEDTLTFNKACESRNPCYKIGSAPGLVYYVGNNNNEAVNYGGSESDSVNFNSIETEYLIPTNANGIYFLETDVPNIVNNLSDTLNFTYNDTTITFDSSSTAFDATTLYNNMYGDDTPLLTSFINVVIDRLTFITSSLHDNYILLSCFTIFTLFFIILLFRRLQ